MRRDGGTSCQTSALRALHGASSDVLEPEAPGIPSTWLGDPENMETPFIMVTVALFGLRNMGNI